MPCLVYWVIQYYIVGKLQFGAIKGTCTTHKLTIMMHEWLKDTDNSKVKHFFYVILLDCAKTFDHIDKNILNSFSFQ